MLRKLKERWNGIPLTVKVSISYTVCSILQKCISFFTAPLFIKMLPTEQYGQFTVYQSWSGIISLVLTLNLAYGSFSTAMVKYEEDRGGYISSVEGISLLLSAVFFLVYLPFNGLWTKLFKLPVSLICLMVVEQLSLNAIQLWSGQKRFEFKYISVILVSLAISVLSPLFAYILVSRTENKGYALTAGYAAGNIFFGTIIFLILAVRGKKLFNREYWNYALGFNIPLLAYYLSQTVFNQSDRIMISHIFGDGKAAMYGVPYSLATILTFVLNAINNSYVPWFFQTLKSGRYRDNRNVSVAISVLMAILLSGIIWFAPEIIMIMAGEEYAEAVYVIPPVAISMLLLFYSQLFINVEFYYEEKGKLIWASIGAAIVNAVLNLIFLPRYGYMAAAYTTLVSYIVFAISNQWAMRKIAQERADRIDDAFDYRILVFGAIAFGLTSFIGVMLYPFIIPRILTAVAVLALLLIKRDYFMDMYKKIKESD